ncbi:tautomerase family protein [Endozoicomonas numazuensis]|uniref:Uncharacterized protein n=1 Tax=Endozoicomonas numazuensis TaxID=1137799 RepID=A0A081NGH7_9GAMM|nr:hypothetical protein [Endozoicomonas numazuensis]KEQ17550.1 hypothetical protein GZ78_17555 [Endozoicomonas numazuensis]
MLPIIDTNLISSDINVEDLSLEVEYIYRNRNIKPVDIDSVSDKSEKSRKSIRQHPYPPKQWQRDSSKRLKSVDSTVIANRAVATSPKINGYEDSHTRFIYKHFDFNHLSDMDIVDICNFRDSIREWKDEASIEVSVILWPVINKINRLEKERFPKSSSSLHLFTITIQDDQHRANLDGKIAAFCECGMKNDFIDMVRIASNPIFYEESSSPFKVRGAARALFETVKNYSEENPKIKGVVGFPTSKISAYLFKKEGFIIEP